VTARLDGGEGAKIQETGTRARKLPVAETENRHHQPTHTFASVAVHPNPLLHPFVSLNTPTHITMPSTTPSSGVQTSTIILATLGTVTTAALAYAVYFDYKRRSDPAFRRSLKRQQKQVSKAAKDEAVAAEKGQKEKVRQVVDEANDEGFPTDPEKTEEYFMTEVARGEQMCQDGSDPVDAALCFYKALKVYPQPRELINIYDKTVPKVLLLPSSNTPPLVY
jgi:import receptor subunit TOM20